VPRTEDHIRERQSEVLRRVRDAAAAGTPAAAIFVGDSITARWERDGAPFWRIVEEIAGGMVLNLGVSGDRTEHVLWRLEEAPIGPLDPRVVVVLIGTNNLGHGTSTAAETLAGVRAVVDRIEAQCPRATIVVLGILPSGEAFNPARGDAAQINQALATLDDRAPEGPRVRFVDLASAFVRADGSIDPGLMPDALHPSEAGYRVLLEALRPFLRPDADPAAP
jgi:beta-glucosidase